MNPVFAVFALILVLSSVQASPPEEKWTQSNPITYTVTFTVHYPDNMLCDSCILNFATDLNATSWSAYTPENGYQTSYLAKRVSQNTYLATETFTSYDVGQQYLATVYYNAWASEGNATQAQWLTDNCRNVLNNLGGNNKGRQFTFVLPNEDVNFDIYPYFCRTRGQVRSMVIPSPQITNTTETTVYIYVPAPILENYLPRVVNYLVQFDGYAIDASLGLQYDAVIENGMTPEFVAFGLGFGTESDPWSDDGKIRQYQLSPYSCTNAYPLANCSQWGGPWGGGFETGDFLYESALPAIWQSLGMLPVGRNNLALSGYSLGGLMACTLAYQNSSRWSAAYCSSGAFWMNGQQFANIVTSSSPTHPIRLGLDFGGRENSIMIQCGKAVYNALLHKKDFVLGENLLYASYLNGPDSHQFNSWSVRTPLVLSFLYSDAFELGQAWVKNGQELESANIVTYGDRNRPFSLGSTFALPAGPESQQQNGAIEGL